MDGTGRGEAGRARGAVCSAERALAVVRDATRATAFEGRIHVVGGYLRDLALGLSPGNEVDLVVEGDAVSLASYLDSRGVTSHRPVVYERFGTAMLCVDGFTVELTSARVESYEPGSRKPNVRPASLYDDVQRRDFTINTLLRSLHSGVVQDLTGLAYPDLAARLIRTPLDPMETFRDDPLRMLRAVRFAVHFGFQIDSAAWDAVREMAHRLNLLEPSRPVVSAERIREEFAKIVEGPDPGRGISLLREAGLLRQFAPELEEMVGVGQNSWHNLDAWGHTLAALARLPPGAPIALRLAVLLHDVGKPRTRAEDGAGVHFLGHTAAGAEIAHGLLRRLRFPGALCQEVSDLVRLHMRVGEVTPEWSDAAIRRLIRDTGHHLPGLFEIARADIAAMGPGAPAFDLDATAARIAAVEAESHASLLRSPLGGREIMRILGVPAGPVIGRAKRFLLDEVIEGRVGPGDTAGAEAALHRWWTAQREDSDT